MKRLADQIMDLTQTNLLTDREIWNAMRSGCGKSFKLIYQQHFYGLYAYGLKKSGDREMVKGAIQELFIFIWQNRNSLPETDGVKDFLMICYKKQVMAKAHLEQAPAD